MALKAKNQIPTQINSEPEFTRNSIIALYVDHVLQYGERPKSVYKFAVDNGMEEADFYQFLDPLVVCVSKYGFLFITIL